MNVEIVKRLVLLGAGVGIGYFLGSQLTKMKYEELIERVEETYTETFEVDTDTHDQTSAAMMKVTIDGKEVATSTMRNVRSLNRRNYNEIASQYAEQEELEHDPAYREGERLSVEANQTSSNPYVITIEEFSEEMDHYDKVTIYFYEDDEVLADANEEPIEDPRALIGDDATEHFGDGSNDPEVVYVRNDKLQIDYEVIRLSKSYAETVGMQ